MTAHVPFLKSILDRPGDDGPHLVYADWLEERGEMDLGEYVRLGVELRRLSPEEPEKRRKELQRRIGELLAAHREEWLGPLARKTGNVMELHDDDGLLCFRFTCTTPHFLKRLKAEAGLPRVPHCWGADLSDLSNHLSAFIACEHLDWLTYLASRDITVMSHQTKELLGCRRLENLRGLDVTFLGDVGARQLAASEQFGKLVALSLRQDRLTEDGLHALLDSRRLPCLRSLALNFAGLQGRQPTALKHTSRHVHLTRLTISNCAAGDAVAAWLAAWPGLASVTWLALHDARIGAAGMEALACSPHLKNLVYLDVSGNPIGDEGLRWIAAAGWLGRLKHLKVTGCGIGTSGALALLAAERLPKTVAIVDGNWLTDVSLKPLRQAGNFV